MFWSAHTPHTVFSIKWRKSWNLPEKVVTHNQLTTIQLCTTNAYWTRTPSNAKTPLFLYYTDTACVHIVHIRSSSTHIIVLLPNTPINTVHWHMIHWLRCFCGAQLFLILFSRERQKHRVFIHSFGSSRDLSNTVFLSFYSIRFFHFNIFCHLSSPRTHLCVAVSRKSSVANVDRLSFFLSLISFGSVGWSVDFHLRKTLKWNEYSEYYFLFYLKNEDVYAKLKYNVFFSRLSLSPSPFQWKWRKAAIGIGRWRRELNWTKGIWYLINAKQKYYHIFFTHFIKSECKSLPI